MGTVERVLPCSFGHPLPRITESKKGWVSTKPEVGQMVRVIPRSFVHNGLDNLRNPMKSQTKAEKEKSKIMVGKVIGVYPQFFTVQFSFFGGNVRESFKFSEPYEVVPS